MNIVVPFACGHGESMLGDGFACALDAIADFWPAISDMFFNVVQQFSAFFFRERPKIRAPHGGCCDRNA